MKISYLLLLQAVIYKSSSLLPNFGAAEERDPLLIVDGAST